MKTRNENRVRLLVIAAVVTSLSQLATESFAQTATNAAAKAMVKGTPTNAPIAGHHSSLAQASQNPLAAMISVPIKNVFNFGVGPDNDVSYNTVWQPIIPVKLTEEFNWINRVIFPAPSYQPSAASGDKWGIGDITYEGWLSPGKPGKVIWGIGPVLGFPSATDDALGSGKWTAGPSLLLVTMPGHFVIGSLFNQSWSYAGDSARANTSEGAWQYFINYNLPKGKGWYLTTSPTMTANWNAPGRNQFTVPVGGGGGKVFRLGKQPIKAELQAFGYPIKPDGGAEWTLQFQVTLLFPEGKKAKK